MNVEERLEGIEETLAQLLQREIYVQAQPQVSVWAPHPALSAREIEMLRYAAAGLSNREIAAQLVISERTVLEHFTRLLSKLHVPNRTTAVMWAYLGGLVTTDQIVELWRSYRPHLLGE